MKASDARVRCEKLLHAVIFPVSPEGWCGSTVLVLSLLGRSTALSTDRGSVSQGHSHCATRNQPISPIQVTLFHSGSGRGAFWCSRRSHIFSHRYCRSLRTSCTWRRASLLSARDYVILPCSSSGLGVVASIWVPQLRLNSKRKGVGMPDRRGSGVVRCNQRAV